MCYFCLPFCLQNSLFWFYYVFYPASSTELVGSFLLRARSWVAAALEMEVSWIQFPVSSWLPKFKKEKPVQQCKKKTELMLWTECLMLAENMAQSCLKYLEKKLCKIKSLLMQRKSWKKVAPHSLLVRCQKGFSKCFIMWKEKRKFNVAVMFEWV